METDLVGDRVTYDRNFDATNPEKCDLWKKHYLNRCGYVRAVFVVGVSIHLLVEFADGQLMHDHSVFFKWTPEDDDEPPPLDIQLPNQEGITVP